MTRFGPVAATVLALAVGLGVSGVSAQEQEEAATQESLRLPYTVERVWFRTDKKKMTGDLTITSGALEFTGRKRSLIVAMESIQVVSFGNMRGDVDTDWAVLSVIDGGVEKTFGIRDGRKFGYGARTREIYEAVKLAVKTLGAAQYRVPRGYRPYVEMDHQFTLAIPADWSWSHLLVVEDEGLALRGTIVYSARPIARETDQSEERGAQLAAVAAGQAAAVVLERRAAVSGMTCDGFSAGGRSRLLEWTEELAPRIKRRNWTFDDLPRVEQATIDNCEGLRVVRPGRNPDGSAATLDVRAVARGRTVFLFVLRSVDDDLEPRTRVLERLLSTFRFSAARGVP